MGNIEAAISKRGQSGWDQLNNDHIFKGKNTLNAVFYIFRILNKISDVLLFIHLVV